MRDPIRFVTDRATLSSVQMSVEGQPLSIQDRELFLDALVQREALYEDLLADRPNQFRRCILGIKSIDVYSFYSDIKKLTSVLMTFISSDDCDDTWPSFKRKAVQELGRKTWFLSTCQAFFPLNEENFIRLRQWLVFDSRMNFHDVDYGPRLEEEYLADEERMRLFSYPDDLVAEMRNVVNIWFRDFDMTKAIPKFGPGATATLPRTASLVQKANELSPNEDLTRIVSEIFWTDPEDFFGNTSLVDSRENRTAKVFFVPKTPITNRVISAEPTTLSWCQQALRCCLYDYIDDHCSEMHLHLRNQEYSQRLALLGSAEGNFATIDLSKASDTNTLQLVRMLFQDRRDILDALESTRSLWSILPSGKVVEMYKFAPMGSAVCFPIESIVFSAACAVAAKRLRHRTQYVVYGDDIVVETALADSVIKILSDLNFIVNVEKSFTAGGRYRFREACGIEALNGRDVTPLRIPRFFRGSFVAKQTRNRRGSKTLSTPEAVAGYTEFINRCTLYGYERLRNVLHLLVRDAFWYYGVLRLPYGADGPMPNIICLGDTATNYRVPRRWNQGLQRTEVRVWTLSVRPIRRPTDDLDHLREFLWFWTKEGQDSHAETVWYKPVGDRYDYSKASQQSWLDIDRAVDDFCLPYDGAAHVSLRLTWVPC